MAGRLWMWWAGAVGVAAAIGLLLLPHHDPCAAKAHRLFEDLRRQGVSTGAQLHAVSCSNTDWARVVGIALLIASVALLLLARRHPGSAGSTGAEL